MPQSKMLPILVPIFAASLGAAAFGAPAGDAAQPGDVIQSVAPPVSQKPSTPPLKLSDNQRAKIRQALSGENTEIDTSYKNVVAAKDFQPAVGSKVPGALKGHTLPPPLIYEMPVLKQFTYVKFKQQVLILDPMSDTIVDMFPET
jgi:hypothetical protein